MEIFVIVENGVVVNRTRAESAMAANWFESDVAQVGWFFDGENFVLPPHDPVYVPSLVSKFQAKASLLHFGHLATVEAIMANPETPELMRLAWTDAQEFRRDSPTVAAMAAALDLTEEDVDNLFIYAEGVTA